MLKRYLVGKQEVFNPLSLKLIDAESEESALMEYRRCEFPKDPEFLKDLADKSVNMSFVERFWLATEEELEAFHSNGHVIATETQFANRVFEAFGDRPELARQYIHYQLDTHYPDVNDLPDGLAEFVAGSSLTKDWDRLFAVLFDGIPLIEMTSNKINCSWVFKDVGQEIETTTDMSVIACATGIYGDDEYKPLLIRDGKFFSPNGEPFEDIVYAYISCPIISYPVQRPMCIFFENDRGVVVDAGRFQLNANETRVVLYDQQYHIRHIHEQPDGKLFVSVESIAAIEMHEQQRELERVQKRTDQRGEREARATVELNKEIIQLQTDARVEKLKSLRMKVHPSFHADFDIQLLKLGKHKVREAKLVRDIIEGRDLFVSLTTQLDNDVSIFNEYFIRSDERFKTDAWLVKTSNENGELISLKVAAATRAVSIASFRNRLVRSGISVFTCQFMKGSNTFLTKKDFDHFNLI